MRMDNSEQWSMKAIDNGQKWLIMMITNDESCLIAAFLNWSKHTNASGEGRQRGLFHPCAGMLLVPGHLWHVHLVNRTQGVRFWWGWTCFTMFHNVSLNWFCDIQVDSRLCSRSFEGPAIFHRICWKVSPKCSGIGFWSKLLDSGRAVLMTRATDNQVLPGVYLL